jgi:uncharacterized protein YcbK (DUF882 family)
MIIKSKEELEKWISENGIEYFKANEFLCPCCGRVKIDTNLILKLEDLRHYFGKPIKINSAYRCPTHNTQVGGVPNSAHTKGKAVDIAISNSSDRYKIISINFNQGIGFKRMGIAKTFIHLDIDNSKPQEVIWLY